MKTVIARFTEMKKNPNEIFEVDGEEVDVNKIDKALKDVGVQLKTSSGEFRDLDDVFLDLAKRWDSLTVMQQRYVATVAAGSRQQSRFIAMMQDYDRTMELVEAANNSAGASQQQFEKTLESLEAKLNSLKVAWDEFTMSLANNDIIKLGVGFLTELLSTVNKINSTMPGMSKSVVVLLETLLALQLVGNVFNKILPGNKQIQVLSLVKKGYNSIVDGVGKFTTRAEENTNAVKKQTKELDELSEELKEVARDAEIAEKELRELSELERQSVFNAYNQGGKEGAQSKLAEIQKHKKERALEQSPKPTNTPLTEDELKAAQSTGKFVGGAIGGAAGAAIGGSLMKAVTDDETAQQVGEVIGTGVGLVAGNALGKTVSGAFAQNMKNNEGKIFKSIAQLFTKSGGLGALGPVLGVALAGALAVGVGVAIRKAIVKSEINEAKKEIKELEKDVEKAKKSAEALKKVQDIEFDATNFTQSTTNELLEQADALGIIVNKALYLNATYSQTVSLQRTLLEQGQNLLEEQLKSTEKNIDAHEKLLRSSAFSADDRNADMAGEDFSFDLDWLSKQDKKDIQKAIQELEEEGIIKEGDVSLSGDDILGDTYGVIKTLQRISENAPDEWNDIEDFLNSEEIIDSLGKMEAALTEHRTAFAAVARPVVTADEIKDFSEYSEIFKRYIKDLEEGGLSQEEINSQIREFQASLGADSSWDNALNTALMSSNSEEYIKFFENLAERGKLELANYLKVTDAHLNDIDSYIKNAEAVMKISKVESSYGFIETTKDVLTFLVDAKVTIADLDEESLNKLRASLETMNSEFGYANRWEDYVNVWSKASNKVQNDWISMMQKQAEGDYSNGATNAAGLKGYQDEINRNASLGLGLSAGLEITKDTLLNNAKSSFKNRFEEEFGGILSGIIGEEEDTGKIIEDEDYEDIILEKFLEGLSNGLNSDDIISSIETQEGIELYGNMKDVIEETYNSYIASYDEIVTPLEDQYNLIQSTIDSLQAQYNSSLNNILSGSETLVSDATNASNLAKVNKNFTSDDINLLNSVMQSLESGKLVTSDELNSLLERYSDPTGQYDNALEAYLNAVTTQDKAEILNQIMSSELDSNKAIIDGLEDYVDELTKVKETLIQFYKELTGKNLELTAAQMERFTYLSKNLPSLNASERQEYYGIFNSAGLAVTDQNAQIISSYIEVNNAISDITGNIETLNSEYDYQKNISDEIRSQETAYQKVSKKVESTTAQLEQYREVASVIGADFEVDADNLDVIKGYNRGALLRDAVALNDGGVQLSQKVIEEELEKHFGNYTANTLAGIRQEILDEIKASEALLQNKSANLTNLEIEETKQHIGELQALLLMLEMSVNDVNTGIGSAASGMGGDFEEWEGSLDRLYNLYEKINELTRQKTNLEKEYSAILREEEGTIANVVENSKKQLKNLATQYGAQKKATNFKAWEVQNYMNQSGLQSYAKYDFDSQQVIVDLEKYYGIGSAEKGEEVDEYISKLEELGSQYEEANDTLYDIESSVYDLLIQGRDQYVALEERVLNSLVDYYQQQIDELSTVNDSIVDSNSKLLDAVRSSIDLQRQQRDNEKKEESIANKEQRLAYLRADTSGANQMEIMQLEQELGEEKLSYGDTLIDQQLDAIQEKEDAAAEARQQQITIAQEQLDYAKENGELWGQVHALIQTGVDQQGNLVETSDLQRIFRSSSELKGLSDVQHQVWQEEFSNQAKAGLGWLGWAAKEEEVRGLFDGYKGPIENLTERIDSYIGSMAEQTKNAADEALKDSGFDKGTPQYTTLQRGSGMTARDWENQIYGSLKGLKIEDYNNLKSIYAVTDADIRNNDYDIRKAIANAMLKSGKTSFSLPRYAAGGMSTSTGPAWLDGTKSRPEAVLNPEQTASFLKFTNLLDSLMSKANLTNISSATNGDTYYNFDIKVDKISNDYDVDKLASRLKKLIVDDSNYRNVNAINLKK